MRKYASIIWDLTQKMKEMMTMNARTKTRYVVKNARMLSTDLACVVQRNVKVRVSIYGLGGSY